MIKRQVFPYFGGKARVADEVWRRLGEVDGYIEPFAGSLAMALRNPHPEALKIETLNDLNGHVCNFWRAVAHAPDEVASWVDWPVSQHDLHARQNWLIEHREALNELLRSDPDAYDAKAAGWWVWGISQWVGSGWCAERPANKRPHLNNCGMGPHSLRQRPSDELSGFYKLYTEIASRLRNARITCCDWKSLRSGVRVRAKTGIKAWGIFLDPPYTVESGREKTLYAEAGEESKHLSLGHEVAAWAREIGDTHRVALCGILGEYEMPGWEVYAWKSGGYSYGDRDRSEVIWFSPACLP